MPNIYFIKTKDNAVCNVSQIQNHEHYVIQDALIFT